MKRFRMSNKNVLMKFAIPQMIGMLFNSVYLIVDGIFIGQGPNFKGNQKIESFKNVDVYPIVARILDLSITQEIDGDEKIADKVLLK